MEGSQLRSYSIGIAAEHKPLTSRMLNVTPVEQLPALDGELAFNPQEHTTVGVDSEGRRYEVKITTDITLTAEWLPMGTNRVTPPDIRRGEIVEVLRLADTDRYFWRCMGLRDDLRRLETVIYAFNASPSESGNGVDINNCYFIEVSTHAKTITLGTSKANGEPFGYNFQFDTGNGTVTLQDDIGNYLHVDSAQSSIRAQNSHKSFVHLDKTNIRLENASGAFVFMSPNQIVADAKQGITLTSGGSTFTLAPSGTTLKSPKFEGSA